MSAFVPAAVTPSLTRTAPASVSASRSYGSWAPASVVAARVAPAAAAPTMTFEAGVFERTNPYAEELKKTANYIARNGRGIMASDESNSTTGKRLAMVDLENTETNRRRWRELLYTAPDLGQYISGCIMYVFCEFYLRTGWVEQTGSGLSVTRSVCGVPAHCVGVGVCVSGGTSEDHVSDCRFSSFGVRTWSVDVICLWRLCRCVQV